MNNKYGCPNLCEWEGRFTICELDEGHEGPCEIVLGNGKRVRFTDPPIVIEPDKGNKD